MARDQNGTPDHGSGDSTPAAKGAGDVLIPAYYLMAACAVGAVALIFVPETAGASLRGTEIPRRGRIKPQSSFR